MTKATKLTLFAALTFALTYLACSAYDMGVAAAQTEAIQAATPDDGANFLALIMSGKYLPAVGAFLVLFVAALRSQLAKRVPWFATKAGGYVLGFGSAFLLYLGTAWQAGTGVSLGLLGTALAAGWTSAGGWETLLDLIAWFKKPTSPTPVSTTPPSIPEPPTPLKPVARLTDRRGFFAVLGATTVGALFWRHRPEPRFTNVRIERIEVRAPDPDRWLAELDRRAKRRLSAPLVSTVLLASLLASCGPKTDIAKEIVINCVSDNQAVIAALGFSMWEKLSGDGSWDDVEYMAKNAGVELGGCALASVVNRWLGEARGATNEQTWALRGRWETYRREVAGGATFRTAEGDL